MFVWWNILEIGRILYIGEILTQIRELVPIPTRVGGRTSNAGRRARTNVGTGRGWRGPPTNFSCSPKTRRGKLLPLEVVGPRKILSEDRRGAALDHDTVGRGGAGSHRRLWDHEHWRPSTTLSMGLRRTTY